MTGDGVADPAVEAAERAWSARYVGGSGMSASESAHHHGVGVLAIAVAREALAPLRELHQPLLRFTPYEASDGCPEHDCAHCDVDWPCDTARLIYREDEL